MSSNIFIVIVQCCYVGISILYTITRLIILTLMALIYAGRYDCLFLAPGIDILHLDSMPETFLKDILIHEAHRHPYIERLGLVYMLKLRHGNKFCTEGGSAWRVLFVLALMPWLCKYRLLGTSDGLNVFEEILLKPLLDEDLENLSSEQDDDSISLFENQPGSTAECTNVGSDEDKAQEFQKALSKMDSVLSYYENKQYPNREEAMYGLKKEMCFIEKQEELLKMRKSALRLKVGQFRSKKSLSLSCLDDHNEKDKFEVVGTINDAEGLDSSKIERNILTANNETESYVLFYDETE